MNDKDKATATVPFSEKVCLVTGGATRVGAATVQHLHGAGCHVIVHCNESRTKADALCESLNAGRPASAAVIQGNLLNNDGLKAIAGEALAAFDRIDFVVNNASTFFATPVGSTSEADWDNLMGVNLKAPYFLIQALAPELRQRRGAIVNLGDIYANRPLQGHPVYCAAKAGLLALTRSLAGELAPDVRTNAVLPGAIVWPDNPDGADREQILARTPLARKGEVDDIASAILYLLRDADFVTGQEIAVDGGRSIVP